MHQASLVFDAQTYIDGILLISGQKQVFSVVLIAVKAFGRGLVGVSGLGQNGV